MSKQNIKDYIKVYDNTLEPEFCKTLIEEFENDLSNQVSAGSNKSLVTTKTGSKLYKNFIEIDFALASTWRQKYNTYLSEMVQRYSDLYFDDIQYPLHLRTHKSRYEGFRIKRYLPDTNERIDEHTDSNNIGTCIRFLSLFWYLNDVEEGGETLFTDLDYYVKPKVGRLLIFPPIWLFPHAGCPVVSEPKYLLHSYLHHSKDTNDFYVLSDINPLKSGAVKPDDINKQ